jgi:hypothetical protein
LLKCCSCSNILLKHCCFRVHGLSMGKVLFCRHQNSFPGHFVTKQVVKCTPVSKS